MQTITQRKEQNKLCIEEVLRSEDFVLKLHEDL